MSDMCDYLENELADHILRNSAYTSPASVYVALLTADPGEAGDTTNEVSASGYARQEATFDAPTDGVTQNTYDIEFPQATEDWGTISHILIMDAATGGNPLFHKILKSGLSSPETFTANVGTAVDLAQDNIIPGSEDVTDTDGTGEYFEGRDYSMDYTNGTITVLSGGTMSDGVDYNIDYEFENPKTINTDDIFKIPAGNLQIQLD